MVATGENHGKVELSLGTRHRFGTLPPSAGNIGSDFPFRIHFTPGSFKVHILIQGERKPCSLCGPSTGTCRLKWPVAEKKGGALFLEAGAFAVACHANWTRKQGREGRKRRERSGGGQIQSRVAHAPVRDLKFILFQMKRSFPFKRAEFADVMF